MRRYHAIVIGVSAGGLEALSTILPGLPRAFSLPVIVVQHRAEDTDGYVAESLNRLSQVRVKEAEDKEPLRAATVYLAPASYHLLVEPDQTLSLSVDPRVNYARPSIDVLFESAADAYQDTLVGVILTGANRDGAEGLARVKECGGLAVVQDPDTAEFEMMPREALAVVPNVDHVVPLDDLAPLLEKLAASEAIPTRTKAQSRSVPKETMP